MDAIKRIVGENNILFRENQILPYCSDSSKIKGECICVALPEDVHQIRKLVLYARLHRMDLVTRGGGSSLAGGAVPQRSIVMDISRLNKIIEINAEEKYAIVEPGVICDDLNTALEKHGLVYPVIPSSSSIATIGGMLANDAAGLWAIKYGKASKWVEEIEAVDGKNIVHKYKKKEDMMQFIGREGTTGIIVKAKLKLTEKPKECSLSIFSFYRIKDAIEKINSEKEKKSILSIEYIDEIIAEKIGLEKKNYLIIEYDKKDEGKISEKDKIDEIMEMRESIGPIMTAEEYSVMEDPYIPNKNMMEFLKWLKDKGVPVFGHIAIGVLHPRFREDQKSLKIEMLKKVIEYGGRISGEHGIGLSKTEFTTEEFKEEIRSLKEKFDPEYILNKNKVIRYDELINKK